MEGSGSLIFLVLMVGVFYFLLIRPQQRRLKALQSLQSSLQLGDEIITSAGFFGTIRRFDGEVVTIELSPGVEARINRRAISGRVNPEPVEDVAEPYLLQLGFLQRTPRGRVATAAAFAHLGLSLPRGTDTAPAPGSLFEDRPE